MRTPPCFYIETQPEDSKESMFYRIMQTVPAYYRRYEDIAVAALLERERMGSTLVVPGLAIAHGQADVFQHTYIGAYMLSHPILWNQEGKRVRVLTLFLLPMQPAPTPVAYIHRLMHHMAEDAYSYALTQAKDIQALQKMLTV